MGKTSSMVLLLLPLSAILFACGGEEAQGPVPVAPGNASIELAPLLSFSANAEIELQFVFENTSQTRITYLGSPEEPFELVFPIYRNDTVVEALETDWNRRGALHENYVQTLESGSRLFKRLRVTHFYGNLPPGLYEVRAEYLRHTDGRLGLTPIVLKRTVLYFEIKASADDRGPQASGIARSQQRSERSDPSHVAVAPLLPLDADSAMEVEVVFENRSKRPLHYLLGHGDKGAASLHLNLFKDSRLVERPTFDPPLLAKQRVRSLGPQDHLIHTLPLRSWYGDLAPGRYEVRAEYRVPEGSDLVTEYGLTPVTFDGVVAYLQIE